MMDAEILYDILRACDELPYWQGRGLVLTSDELAGEMYDDMESRFSIGDPKNASRYPDIARMMDNILHDFEHLDWLGLATRIKNSGGAANSDNL